MVVTFEHDTSSLNMGKKEYLSLERRSHLHGYLKVVKKVLRNKIGEERLARNEVSGKMYLQLVKVNKDIIIHSLEEGADLLECLSTLS